MEILLIEDSEVQVRLIKALFQEQNQSEYNLYSASDLQSGIRLLEERDFDAVLLDLTLPDSAAVDSCRRVGESHPEIPIVVLTGLDDQELALSTLQQGAEDYLVKGDIDSRLLVRAVRYAIERKRVMLALQDAHDALELRVEERTAQLKQMQEEARVLQQELNHAGRLNTLGELASGIAHELNQPLMAIIGFADSCLEMVRQGDVDSDKLEDTLHDTGQEARRAAQIIKKMRRLVSRQSAEHVLADLNRTIAEAIPLVRPEPGISIIDQMEPSLPPTLIDRIQIQQVILNLASNAVNAMNESDAERRSIMIRTGQQEETSELFVEVADNGTGLPEEDLDRLFQPFFSRTPDGLGLGLSISKSIVESHGGQLSAENNHDGGLTFRFTIPIRAAT